MSIEQRLHRLACKVRAFGADETGATAIEYGLIAALIAVGIISALRSVGTNLSNTFARVGTALTR